MRRSSSAAGRGRFGGHLLSNGPVDTYADLDTVAYEVGRRSMVHFIDHGARPDDVIVEDDHGD